MVRRDTLVAVAAAVWFAAGINILRIGVAAATVVKWEWWMIVSAVAVFLGFGTMFQVIVRRHLGRIFGYDDTVRHSVFKFFDLKAYILMAVMMGGGLTLRGLELVPDRCTAMFYTGLGAGLAIAGCTFFAAYLRRPRGV